MTFQVLFSDTAREDFSQLQEESPERVRMQTLVERIATEAVGEDHVLSAPESSFELRYLSLETTYVFFRRDQVKGQATVIYFCEMDVQPAAAPLPPRSHRLIDLQTHDIPHGMDVETAMEFTRADGSRSLQRAFARKIDLGDSYVVFTHMASGTSPATTMIVSGKKGQIEGDFRHDEIELVMMQPDGTARRLPTITSPVYIKSPFEGVPPDQMLDRMDEWMKTPEVQARMEWARTWLQQSQPDHSDKS